MFMQQVRPRHPKTHKTSFDGYLKCYSEQGKGKMTKTLPHILAKIFTPNIGAIVETNTHINALLNLKKIKINLQTHGFEAQDDLEVTY